MKTPSDLQARLASVWPLLDERTRRLMAANEALALGHGGISEVSRSCGLSRKAIAKGIKEIKAGNAPPPGRVRQPRSARVAARRSALMRATFGRSVVRTGRLFASSNATVASHPRRSTSLSTHQSG